ncbi:hypothetical protein [Mesobacillus selenatarsenatis]|uniref:Uncharacterized protein n=1 Tax=Mesobacillus selenatarsenatis TaxID=388741 RepID=A0A846TLJ1_9BACI|nr:hypothetical protein [Mesobacillus selenatarsenatis]NKE07830.1 hypothetical protein [Mesobacillus selenatarsenatis]
MGFRFCKNHSAKKPFNNDIQICCDCGDCCLVHQQFTLEQNVNFDEETTVQVYDAGGYQSACIPGQSGADEETIQQETVRAFPFGTLIVSNAGDNPFDLEVVQADLDDTFNATVFPGADVAFTGVIREVNVTTPVDPIRAFFHFDIFLLPVDPILPPNPI